MQWSEALDRLVALAAEPSDPSTGTGQDEERGVPAGLPRGEAARMLRAKFERFVAWITPPAGARSYRAFVGWLETLIGPMRSGPMRSGPTTSASPGRFAVAEDPTSLQVVAQARGGDAALAERDIAALAGLKDVLRGLVWAEEALPTGPPVDFTRFVTELTGALDAASYCLPQPPADRERKSWSPTSSRPAACPSGPSRCWGSPKGSSRQR